MSHPKKATKLDRLLALTESGNEDVLHLLGKLVKAQERTNQLLTEMNKPRRRGW